MKTSKSIGQNERQAIKKTAYYNGLFRENLYPKTLMTNQQAYCLKRFVRRKNV